MPEQQINMNESLRPDQLLSEDVQEIISYRPHWFIRRGSMLFLVIVGALLLLSFVIKYPDLVKGTARIVAANAPRTLIAKTDGRIEKLLVKNGETVTKGQLLAFLQSTGNHEQILALKQWISATEPAVLGGDLSVIVKQPPPAFTQLGDLQAAYQEFEIQLHETKQILGGGYYQQKRIALAKDKQYIDAIKASNRKIQSLEQTDYAMQKKEHDIKQQLADEKVIAPLEMNADKSKLISIEQTIEQLGGQLVNSDATRHSKDKEILDVQKHIADQAQSFQSALLGIKSKVDEWLDRYVLIASESGKLEYLSFFEERQLVSPGQELFFIQPANSIYYAEMRAGQESIGKMKTGQSVIIRLAGYPGNEFGYLEGAVSYISSIPNARDSFSVKVDLKNGLQTTYHKPVYFRNNLLGSAEVITDDRRLADRLFGDLRDALRR